MARLHNKWNNQQRSRNYRDVGSVLAVNIWKLAADCLLNLENEGFETISLNQRLDVICEFSAYLLHLLDRLVYQKLEEDSRNRLIQTTANSLAKRIADNRTELTGGDHHQATLNLINQRGIDYAECRFDSNDDGPGFTMMRLLGETVQATMGEKDGKWIPDYVIANEAPRSYSELRKTAEKILGL